MANIIIPPEHQSAPKVAPQIVSPFAANAPAPKPAAGPRDRAYENEMDLVDYENPHVQQAVDSFVSRMPVKSTNETIEAALHQFEKNLANMKPYRWDGQERWQGRENEEMRMVRIMHPHTFIEKLQRAGIAARVDDPLEWYRQNLPCKFCGSLRAFHDKRHCSMGWDCDFPKPYCRLWLNSFSSAGRVGITALLENQARTVTALQYPYGPEYSIMRFNEYNVPTNEKYRGWRTALLALITADVITEEEADRAFGPAIGAASAFYKEQLFHHRHVRYGVKPKPTEIQ